LTATSLPAQEGLQRDDGGEVAGVGTNAFHDEDPGSDGGGDDVSCVDDNSTYVAVDDQPRNTVSVYGVADLVNQPGATKRVACLEYDVAEPASPDSDCAVGGSASGEGEGGSGNGGRKPVTLTSLGSLVAVSSINSTVSTNNTDRALPAGL
jgi:hypothetical protein